MHRQHLGGVGLGSVSVVQKSASGWNWVAGCTLLDQPSRPVSRHSLRWLGPVVSAHTLRATPGRQLAASAKCYGVGGTWGNIMVIERDEFFAELDGLTEKEIEARLDLWDREQLALIQEYLDQRVMGRAKAEQAAQITAAPSAQDDAAMASLVEIASTANTKATAALILSAGAMLAAIASALVAFLALRGWTISW